MKVFFEGKITTCPQMSIYDDDAKGKACSWSQCFRVCSGTYCKDKPRRSLPGPRQWDIASTRQEVREPPRTLLSGGDAVLIPPSDPTRRPARTHQQCLYQASPCCDHQTKSPSEGAVGTVSRQALPTCSMPPMQLRLTPSP